MANQFLDTIDFKETLPSIEDYWVLFGTTGWNEEYRFSKSELEEAIKNSWFCISTYKSGKLIGFGRVIADGIHHALIVDLIVHPDYQSKGIGSRILERLVKKCRDHNIRDIQLFAAGEKYQFYEKQGFEKRPENAPGMQFKAHRPTSRSGPEGTPSELTE
jgi:N-acetylglutamate synthase-like GNAT family acetyltransferase